MMMTDDFLEHYGVLGMKWGVRRTPEELGHRDTQKQDDVFSRMEKGLKVTKFVSSSDLAAGYDIYDSIAKKYMKQALDELNKKAYETGDNEINNVVGERSDQLWAESYKKAANDIKVSDELLPLLIAYAALVERGIEDEYSIGYAEKDGKKVLVFRNIRDLKIFETVNDAYDHSRYLRLKKGTQREKKVEDVAPVAVKKGEKVPGGSVNPYADNSVSTSSLNKVLQTAAKKKQNDMKHSSDFLEHYGVLGMKWGVRKDDEPLGERSSPSKYAETVQKAMRGLEVTGYVENKNLKQAYDTLEALAQHKMDIQVRRARLAAARTGLTQLSDIRGEYADKLWEKCYKQAVAQVNLSEDSMALLAVYSALEKRGIASYFDIGFAEKDGKRTMVIIDKENKKTFETVDAAAAYVKQYKDLKSRERHVTGTATVTVKKDSSVQGTPYNDISGSILAEAKKKENAAKAREQMVEDKFRDEMSEEKKKKPKKVTHYAYSIDSLTSLEHYGVKGQKWGVRRTPEQLGHRGESVIKRITQKLKKASEKKKKKQTKVKQESDEEIRQKVLKSVDPKYIYKHRALLDDKELQGRIDRINKETTLKKLAQPDGQAYKVAKEGENWLRTSANMMNSVKDIYTAMNVINSISQKGVKKSESSTVNINIGGKKDKKKEKKDENK